MRSNSGSPRDGILSVGLRYHAFPPRLAVLLFLAIHFAAPESRIQAAPQIQAGSLAPPSGVQSPAHPLDLIEVVRVQSDSSAKLSLRNARQDILAFTKRLQSADEPPQRIAAIVDLCGLYLQIIADPRFARAEPLQGYRGRIGARLQRESKALKREFGAADSGAPPDVTAAAVTWEADAEYSNDFASGIIDPHWELIGHFGGATGPVSYHASGLHGSSGHFLRGMNAGQMFDHGPELVALIEAILHPDYWQAAGGEGTIHYYQPLRILVIRARTTVHEDIEEFLERLR